MLIPDLFANWERPQWDDWFMTIAFAAAMRSIDPSTKHGAVIADRYKSIVSVGYNGPPPDLDDSKVPLSRPEKYAWMKHAEDNAIKRSRESNLEGMTVYVTGFPCDICFGDMLSKRIARVVYGPIEYPSGTPEVIERVHRMNTCTPDGKPKIELCKYEGDARDSFSRAITYIDMKVGPRTS